MQLKFDPVLLLHKSVNHHCTYGLGKDQTPPCKEAEGRDGGTCWGNYGGQWWWMEPRAAGQQKAQGKLLVYWKLLLKLLHNLHKTVADRVSLEWGMASDPVCFFLAQGTTHSRQTGCYPCEIFSLNFKTEKTQQQGTPITQKPCS